MARSCDCTHCPVFRRECEGCIESCRFRECDDRCTSCAVRCHRHEDLDGRLAAIGGLTLDVPLKPQARFSLPLFLPQLVNGLLLGLLDREPVLAVGIEKVLTPRGEISQRAIPHPPGDYSLRTRWHLREEQRLVCVGNAQDDYLEKLWNAQARTNIWSRITTLGFNAATSLNFSIYLDDPRLEHLINIKRTWLTVRRMQETTGTATVAAKPSLELRSSLIPIPHLQWATLLDLERQLDYVQTQGFHTLTLNLQMIKHQGWDTVAEGLALIRERAPGLRLLFAGVAGLKRIAKLAHFFPERSQVSFANVNAHYLAEHYIRLQRAASGPAEGPLEEQPDLTRLIKEPVTGHPDRILLDNVCLYQDFLAELYGPEPLSPRAESPEMRRYLDAMREIRTALTTRFGFPAGEADDWADRLATDEEILYAFQDWLRTGQACGERIPSKTSLQGLGRTVDRDFRGSFPTWPDTERVPHPTLGELLDGGKTPLEAFLHQADLAHRVYSEIELAVGRAGY